ncbi:MAG: electron transfer flavoprotein subunit beta/FixA family protein, partial [Firmicutes bacterium]|nr:electron transfer flavoprotein subunit beta/FixA family protein [Bacillota bacterium]
ISFGLETVKDAVRKALAVKASEGVVITSDKDIRYDATATAMILSRAIKKLGNVDLVICGRQAGDWDAGQVGPILAEMLDIPCISFARKIEREGDLLVITHEIEDGVEVVEVKPPLLVSATNHEGNVLRLAKVKDVIAAQRKPLTSWDLNDLGISPDDIASNAVTELQNLYIPEVSGHCEFISAETAEEKTDALIAKLESLKLF